VAFFEPSEKNVPKRSAVTATHTDYFHRLRMGIHAGANLKLCAIGPKIKSDSDRVSNLIFGSGKTSGQRIIGPGHDLRHRSIADCASVHATSITRSVHRPASVNVDAFRHIQAGAEEPRRDPEQ